MIFKNRIFIVLLFAITLFAVQLVCPVRAFAAETSSKAVTYEEKTVDGIRLKIVLVDPKDPSIGFKVTLSENQLGKTKSFDSIVKEEKAIVSVNGNFFDAYNKQGNFAPIGNLMIAGELVQSSAGTPNIGITSDNKFAFGMPGFFLYLTTIPRDTGEDPFSFVAYDTNIRGQQLNSARLYTPYFGEYVEISCAGTVYRFEDHIFTSRKKVKEGDKIGIPENGCILFYGAEIPAYNIPKNAATLIGIDTVLEYRLFNPDDETKKGFKDTGIVSLMAGNIRLVSGGSIVSSSKVYGAENDSRWSVAAPRTAIGQLKDGKLIIVSTASATMKKLAEALQKLGCTEAVNLDGGGSTALAVDGNIKTRPGRNLAVTFHVINKSVTSPPEERPCFFVPRYTKYAEALEKLGLLSANKDGGFDLDKPVTLREMKKIMKILNVTMTDLPSAVAASPKNGISAQAYVTFLLRALGYPEGSNGTFLYEEATQYAQRYFALAPPVTYYEWDHRNFLRDDMVVVTYRALNLKMKNRYGKTLADELIKAGIFTAEQAAEAGLKVSR